MANSRFNSLDVDNFSSPYGFTSIPFCKLHPSHIRGRGCRDIRSCCCSRTPRLCQHHHLRTFWPQRKQILGDTTDLSTRPPPRSECIDCSLATRSDLFIKENEPSIDDLVLLYTTRPRMTWMVLAVLLNYGQEDSEDA